MRWESLWQMTWYLNSSDLNLNSVQNRRDDAAKLNTSSAESLSVRHHDPQYEDARHDTEHNNDGATNGNSGSEQSSIASRAVTHHQHQQHHHYHYHTLLGLFHTLLSKYALHHLEKYVVGRPVMAESTFVPSNWGRSSSASSYPTMPHSIAVLTITYVWDRCDW